MRLQSCKVHPLTPQASSKDFLNVDKLPFLKTKGPLSFCIFAAIRTSIAATLSGLTRSTLVLFRSAGSVHSVPSSSSHVISAASVRLALVSRMKQTKGPRAPSAFHTFRSSSSERIRLRARSVDLVRAMPLTIGGMEGLPKSR